MNKNNSNPSRDGNQQGSRPHDNRQTGEGGYIDDSEWVDPGMHADPVSQANPHGPPQQGTWRPVRTGTREEFEEWVRQREMYGRGHQPTYQQPPGIQQQYRHPGYAPNHPPYLPQGAYGPPSRQPPPMPTGPWPQPQFPPAWPVQPLPPQRAPHPTAPAPPPPPPPVQAPGRSKTLQEKRDEKWRRTLGQKRRRDREAAERAAQEGRLAANPDVAAPAPAEPREVIDLTSPSPPPAGPSTVRAPPPTSVVAASHARPQVTIPAGERAPVTSAPRQRIPVTHNTGAHINAGDQAVQKHPRDASDSPDGDEVPAVVESRNATAVGRFLLRQRNQLGFRGPVGRSGDAEVVTEEVEYTPEEIERIRQQCEECGENGCDCWKTAKENGYDH